MKRILFCCQVLDTADPALSFFHEWIKKFSNKFDKITVIALKVGKVDLPEKVQYFSLGKEKYSQGSFKRFFYIFNLIVYSWKTRNDYDTVFVHMNQEFILVAGLLWKILGKKIYLWYNHYSGNIFTNTASIFCEKIFFTSKGAYTSRFSRSIQMPVGVNTDIFGNSVNRDKDKIGKILFLARISKSKRLEDLIKAVSLAPLIQMEWSVQVTGPTISEDDKKYLSECRDMIGDLGLTSRFVFTDGIPFIETPRLYSNFDIFINCSKTGMYDKTIFEASASGCIVISSSVDYRDEVGDNYFFNFGDYTELSNKIVNILNLSKENRYESIKLMKEVANRHSLDKLSEKIVKEIYG